MSPSSPSTPLPSFPPPYYPRETDPERDTILPENPWWLGTSSSSPPRGRKPAPIRILVALLEYAFLIVVGGGAWLVNFVPLALDSFDFGPDMGLVFISLAAVLPTAYLHRRDLRRMWWGFLWVFLSGVLTSNIGNDPPASKKRLSSVVLQGSLPLATLVTALVAVGYNVFDPRLVGDDDDDDDAVSLGSVSGGAAAL